MAAVENWDDVLQCLAKGEISAVDRISDFVGNYLAAIGAYQVRNSWEDLIQEVLITLFEKPPQVSGAKTAAAYIRTTTYRKYVDQIRREEGRRRRSPEGAEARAQGWRKTVPLEEGAHSLGVDSAAVDGLDISLRKALAQLDERRRRVLECKYFLGFTNEEGARHTGEPLGTYKRLLTSGLAQRHDLLVPRGGPP